MKQLWRVRECSGRVRKVKPVLPRRILCAFPCNTLVFLVLHKKTSNFAAFEKKKIRASCKSSWSSCDNFSFPFCFFSFHSRFLFLLFWMLVLIYTEPFCIVCGMKFLHFISCTYVGERRTIKFYFWRISQHTSHFTSLLWASENWNWLKLSRSFSVCEAHLCLSISDSVNAKPKLFGLANHDKITPPGVTLFAVE